ncbi:MAG TPA: ATP-binding protein [Streptosporangiaceae bacterium]
MAGYQACRRTFLGTADQVSEARRFVTDHLAAAPEELLFLAELVASELATNAVTHTRSGEPGGVFQIAVELRPAESICITAYDEGSTSHVIPHSAAEDEESGRGLAIIETLAMQWGVVTTPGRHGVYCELDWQTKR